MIHSSMASFHYHLGKLAAMASLPGAGDGPGLELYTSEGIDGVGGMDANQRLPDRWQRQTDAIRRGFDVVFENQVDQIADSSSHIGEPGVVSHRYKVAASVGVTSSSVVMPPTTDTATKVKAPSIKGDIDPRTDKPPGQNLQHGLQTVTYGSAMGNATTSFARRLQGSPV